MTARIEGINEVTDRDISGLTQEDGQVEFDARSLPGFMNALANMPSRTKLDKEKFVAEVVRVLEIAMSEGIVNRVKRRDFNAANRASVIVEPLSKLE